MSGRRAPITLGSDLLDHELVDLSRRIEKLNTRSGSWGSTLVMMNFTAANNFRPNLVMYKIEDMAMEL